MKLFSNFNKHINENCTTADINPGNSMSLGVTNHLTPIQNIVTNVRNLFSTLPIVASVAEDGFSIKLNSSQFTSETNINKLLYEPVWQNQSLYSYIRSQGLCSVRVVNVGMYYIVYISPDDINVVAPGLEPTNAECPCSEMLDHNIEEAEMVSLISEGEDDDEIEELTKKRIKDIITAKDKVKAAKQFNILVSQQISLPMDYYFAGVKSKDGDESIALRWKFIKRRPHGKTAEITHSLMNIFGDGDEAVWVGDFDKKTIYQLPNETKKLIESILELIGAEKTSDSCIYKIPNKEEDKKKEDDKMEESDEEDDNSRGEESSEDDSDNKKKEQDDLL